jgi:RNA polymerase sigma-70 factor, ECF subfamily
MQAPVNPAPGEVTVLLARLSSGDRGAVDELIPLVYTELRRLAGHFMRRERPGHTLQPTDLAHEAYLALVDQDRANWQNRAHFMAVAAQAMRRILLQYARRRRAAKRVAPDAGAGVLEAHVRWEEVLAVDEALTRLAALSAQQASIAELRYFGGLSVEEAAEALDISPRTVKREWAAAKAWLHTQLAGGAFE